ncbi:MAG: hypothetical protein JRE24_13020 [Deltaproteobacteria bacterium]|nr:hypothetical protein [Deltaproteobacteria bacterium]
MGEDVLDYRYNRGASPRLSCLAAKIPFTLVEAELPLSLQLLIAPEALIDQIVVLLNSLSMVP